METFRTSLNMDPTSSFPARPLEGASVGTMRCRAAVGLGWRLHAYTTYFYYTLITPPPRLIYRFVTVHYTFYRAASAIRAHAAFVLDGVASARPFLGPRGPPHRFVSPIERILCLCYEEKRLTRFCVL